MCFMRAEVEDEVLINDSPLLILSGLVTSLKALSMFEYLSNSPILKQLNSPFFVRHKKVDAAFGLMAM